MRWANFLAIMRATLIAHEANIDRWKTQSTQVGLERRNLGVYKLDTERTIRLCLGPTRESACRNNTFTRPPVVSG